MTSEIRKLTPLEEICTQFLCDLTDYGRIYTVLEAKPELKGVRMQNYTLGQLFDRLADFGGTTPCVARERLLEESRELLAPFLIQGIELQEGTVLGEALAEP